MRTRRLPILALFCCVAVALLAQAAPTLTLSTTRVQHRGFVTAHGAGFTPAHNVSSHLRKPDGSEFPTLPILTDRHGEFSHKIDTLILVPGIYQMWVVDDGSKASSSVVQFEVTPE